MDGVHGCCDTREFRIKATSLVNDLSMRQWPTMLTEVQCNMLQDCEATSIFSVDTVEDLRSTVGSCIHIQSVPVTWM